MATLPTPFGEIQRVVATYHAAMVDGYPPPEGRQGGERTAVAEATARLGYPDGSRNLVKRMLDIGVALGVEVRGWRVVSPTFADQTLRRYRAYDADFRDAETRLSRPVSPGSGAPRTVGPPPRRQARAAAPVPGQSEYVSTTVVDTPKRDPQELVDRVVPLLRKGPLTLDEIAAALDADATVATLVLMLAHQQGAAVAERAGKWHLDVTPALGIHRNTMLEFVTDDDGTFTFAACGDMHMGSKYERLDCLGDYYDQIEARGITTVLNGGNWIDGEASFNQHDLLVHGMDAQIQYMVRHYPQRPGVTTYAVTGADHEGWYAKREGVDVGRYAENAMRNANRTDWQDLGYMEAFIRLRHKSSGEGSMISLMHPGGGSAYALSYAPQKIVEAFDGGDKPAALLVAHYHKSGYNLIRNVHAMQTGTFQDQTVFMRQRKLAAHVGGCFVKLTVDPRTGAFNECAYTFRNYFNRAYTLGRWSQHGDVTHTVRTAT